MHDVTGNELKLSVKYARNAFDCKQTLHEDRNYFLRSHVASERDQTESKEEMTPHLSRDLDFVNGIFVFGKMC